MVILSSVFSSPYNPTLTVTVSHTVVLFLVEHANDASTFHSVCVEYLLIQ